MFLMARKSRTRAIISAKAGTSKSRFSYHCYPFSHINKSHCEDGNKIIMPASALGALMSMQDIEYPMTFKIINPVSGKVSHCGVLEFSGEEGFVYLPKWLMNNLILQPGEIVNIKYSELTKATYLKLQPHSTKFIMNLLEDPKDVMERILKDFACVTVGDTITVNYGNQSYYIDIVEAKPGNYAVSLFETDCEVDFEKALDYKEPEQIRPEEVAEHKAAMNLKNHAVYKPLTGVCRRMDGQVSATPVAEKDEKNSVVASREHAGRFVCGSNNKCCAYKKRGNKKVIEDVKEKTKKEIIEEKKFQPFTGKKFILSDW